jgi:hypothetical protein
MFNPLDVKKKVLGAVKAYGREGVGEHLKKGYGKPAIAISVETVRPMGKHGGMSEEAEGEGELSPEMLKRHEGMEPEAVKEAEGEYGESEGGEHMMPDGKMMKDSEMGEGGKGKITPELLEMLLAKLGK